MTSSELENRLKSFAYSIVKVCEALPSTKTGKVVEDQLIRSSFSAAANYRAACRAISKKSFVSKLSIAFEESDESLFWLEVISELKLVASSKLSAVLKEAGELAAILAAARKTSQTNVNKILPIKS